MLQSVPEVTTIPPAVVNGFRVVRHDGIGGERFHVEEVVGGRAVCSILKTTDLEEACGFAVHMNDGLRTSVVV